MILKLLALAGILFASVAPADAPEPYKLAGITPVMLEDIGPYTSLEPTRILLVKSSGGVIDTAFSMVPHLGKVICVVGYAASAALQIVLPACDERYYLPWAMIAFHSAHAHIPVMPFRPFVINMWDAAELTKRLEADNRRMLRHMRASGIPFSPRELLKHIKEETVFRGPQISRAFGDWLRPISQCATCPISWKRLSPKAKRPASAQ